MFIVVGRTWLIVLIALVVLILPVVGNGDGTGTGAGSGTGAPQNTADNAVDFSQFFSESEQEMLETNEELEGVRANLLLAISECSAKEEERLQKWQTLEQKRVVMEQRQEILDQRTEVRVQKETVRDDKQTDLDGKQAALNACEDCSCGDDEDCSCPDCSSERRARDNAQTELNTAQTELDDAIAVETTAQDNFDTADIEHTTAETEFTESAECADGACLVQGDLEGVDLRQGGCSEGPCVSFSTDDATITSNVESQVGEDPEVIETTTDADLEVAFTDMEAAFTDMDTPEAMTTDFDAAAGDFLIDGANRLEDLIIYSETMAEAYNELGVAMGEDNEELTAYLEGKDPMGLTPAELEDLFTFVMDTKDELPVDDNHFFDAMRYLSSEEGELFLADVEEKSLAGTISGLNMDKETLESVIDDLQEEKEFYQMLLFWAMEPEDIAWVLEEIALIEGFQDALRSEVTRIDSEMVELNEQREKAEADKTAIKESLEAAEAKVTTATNALNQCNTGECDDTTVTQLQLELQQAEEERNLLQTQLEETNTLIEDLEAKGGALEEEKENLETTVNTFDDIIGGEDVDPDALTTLVDITKNKATETVDTIDEQIDLKKDEQGQITITIGKNQNDLEDKQAQTEKERQELAQRQLEEAQKKEQELKQTKTELSTGLTAAEEKLAYIEEQLKAATEEGDKKTLEDLKQQVIKEREELESQLGEIANQIDQARDRRHELEDKYGVGNPEQRAAESQIDQAKIQETQLEKNRDRLTTDIKEKDQVLATLEEQLNGASTDEERKQLEEQKAIVLNERDQLSTQLEGVDQDIQEATANRQELEKKYKEQYGAAPPEAEPKVADKEEKPGTAEEATSAFESVIENIEQAGVGIEGEEAVTEAPPNTNPNVEFLNAVTETLERVGQSAANEERDEDEPESPKKKKKRPEPVIIPPPVASYVDPFPTQYSPIGTMSIIEEPLVAVAAAPPPSTPSISAPVTPAGPVQPSQPGEVVTAPRQLDPVDAADLAAVFVDGEQLETPDGATILVDSTTNEVYKVTQEGVETTGTDQLHIQERVDPLTGDTEYFAVVGNVTDENSTLNDIAAGNATDIAEEAIIEIRYLDDAKNVLFIGPRCQMTNLTDVEVRIVTLNDTVINATKNETNATVMLLDISCIPAVTVDKDDPEANVVTFLEEMECFGAEVGRCLNIELYMVVIGKDENLWEVQCIEKLYSGIE